MKISRLPDGRILVSDLRDTQAGAGNQPEPLSHVVVPVGTLLMSAADFTRLVDLGVHMELQAPSCIFIEG